MICAARSTSIRPWMADLDADQSTVSGRLEETGDLEPAQAELPGDLDLGALIEVVPARHQGCECQARGSGYCLVT